MAEILLKDLIEIIKEHPRYLLDWENGVPLEESLYIKFHSKEVRELSSIIYEAVDGSELIVDQGKDNKIYGLEII